MLPKKVFPLTKILVPSLKAQFNFRPFSVQEEKILLLANESDGDDRDITILRACLQVIENCYSDKLDINFSTLASFDVTYLFLKLRAISISNIMEVRYKDAEDGEVREFSIDLDALDITIDFNHSNTIKIYDDISIKMKYPAVGAALDINEGESIANFLDRVVMASIDKIYDADTVYEDYTDEELQEFFNTAPVGTYEKFKIFFSTLPKVQHIISYENKNGNKIDINLSTLDDFFIWLWPTTT